MLLRALEHAKRGADAPRQVLWIKAEDTPLKNNTIGRSKEQIDRKLTRFLQMHDQRTKGIPGFLLLYEGAPVRTTERIICGGSITVLKHTSGEIVGWELGTADEHRSKDFQKMLQYLPKVIYVKFKSASWQLNGLSQGVLPMFPVQRQWILNKQNQVKLSRKGFTLVPDFASTAFMTQGETHEGLIADCGDLYDVVGMAEMLTCYVIL